MLFFVGPGNQGMTAEKTERAEIEIYSSRRKSFGPNMKILHLWEKENAFGRTA